MSGRQKRDLSGQRFGRLTVLRRGGEYRSPGGSVHSVWLCRCDCGRDCEVLQGNLLSGNTRSCGCRMNGGVRKKPPRRGEPEQIGSLYGEAMRRARLEKGWTLEKLAKRSGLSRQSIQRYEKEYSIPRLPAAVWLAEALGISLDAYIGREGGHDADPG